MNNLIIKDSKRIVLADAIPQSYLTDGLKLKYGQADILVYPKTTEEVADVVKFANANNLNITTRGAGTNLVGSTIPNGGIILDLSLMNEIVELDKETFTITVQPGILLQDLQQFVEQYDLFYPPDPGAKTSTIGGNISTNAGGMRAVKYGVTRDYVQALEVVMADGSVLNIGSKNVKDNTGLTLKHLFIGSEGTLGIITQCTLKLIAKPKVSQTFVVGFNTIEQAIASITTILHTLTPTALEFVERKVAQWGEKYSGFQFPLPHSQAYLIIMLDGLDQQSIEQQRKQLLVNLGDCDYFVAEDSNQASQIWTIRGSLVRAVEAVTEQDPIDIVVPINRIADFIHFTKQLEAKTKVRMLAFGHAGDGNIHLCILRDDRDDKQWDTDLQQVHQALYQKCLELGGLPSAEHGIGTAKVSYYNDAIPKANRQLMHAIKQQFDPKNLLNNQVYMTMI
ncbi:MULTISPECIES: FAD-binding oxidoreductase [unclassified Gilliamella]|uniref:FAD-binding oxidoreductase n=1 Tax=unclassified Gilliamella TaxID=2685620 RepID=UPI002269D0A4|nr:MULTISPECIES: FAD-binding oxidoreductase [unclassified Gilliamella]MCX8597312.1 FAD-binding oxidoreductase [Gilliamella sp. B3493]MCX8598939.1 FAD-binding oxidoreductase [Gilliamella sp. B3486]MCX8689052.1 FAD-binding oxidoreductase [Gilliamella sp. B2973]MCX8704755.1 FAD-binding oxidoreductase [Gilliamella sp. B3127]